MSAVRSLSNVLHRALCFGGMMALFFAPKVLANQAAPLLITGKITSNNIQTVSAPRTDRWNIQIQWMIEEGTIVSVGDVIAMFDSGSVAAQLEQNEDTLAAQRLELDNTVLTQTQLIDDAQSDLDIAKLEVEKARIEANITSDDVSDYDKGQYKLTLERALVEKFKAEQALQQAINERDNKLEKQRIEITKLEENIAYQRYQLSQLQVKATIDGVVSYLYHPWNNEKITPGTSLQATMKAMEVQDIDGFKIDAWVHEADADRINVNQQATVTLDAYPLQKYSAVVQQKVSQPEKKASWGNSAYYQLELMFTEQPQQKLLPGMSVRVVFEPEEHSDDE